MTHQWQITTLPSQQPGLTKYTQILNLFISMFMDTNCQWTQISMGKYFMAEADIFVGKCQ